MLSYDAPAYLHFALTLTPAVAGDSIVVESSVVDASIGAATSSLVVIELPMCAVMQVLFNMLL